MSRMKAKQRGTLEIRGDILLAINEFGDLGLARLTAKCRLNYVLFKTHIIELIDRGLVKTRRYSGVQEFRLTEKGSHACASYYLFRKIAPK
jgi:predicted transcriptional regulator